MRFWSPPTLYPTSRLVIGAPSENLSSAAKLWALKNKENPEGKSGSADNPTELVAASWKSIHLTRVSRQRVYLFPWHPCAKLWATFLSRGSSLSEWGDSLLRSAVPGSSLLQTTHDASTQIGAYLPGNLGQCPEAEKFSQTLGCSSLRNITVPDQQYFDCFELKREPKISSPEIVFVGHVWSHQGLSEAGVESSV